LVVGDKKKAWFQPGGSRVEVGEKGGKIPGPHEGILFKHGTLNKYLHGKKRGW